MNQRAWIIKQQVDGFYNKHGEMKIKSKILMFTRKVFRVFFEKLLRLKCRRGITREVLITKRVVIKIPSFRTFTLFLAGWQCNRDEKVKWLSSQFLHLESRVEHNISCKLLLCPVLHSFFWGFFLVMRRAAPFESEDQYEDMVQVLRSNSEIEYYCTDHHESNYGLLEDRIVCVDYGD